jgi:hypothetical protein
MISVGGTKYLAVEGTRIKIANGAIASVYNTVAIVWYNEAVSDTSDLSKNPPNV